jgi:PAS domain S-box-containing protein
MLDGALDCVVTMDHEGRVVDFNPAAERTFGYRAGEAIGRAMAELIIPPELRERHRRGLARYLATEEPVLLNRRLEITGMRSGRHDVSPRGDDHAHRRSRAADLHRIPSRHHRTQGRRG